MEKSTNIVSSQSIKTILASALLCFSSVQYANSATTTVTDAIGTQEIWTFDENLGVQNMTSRVNLSDGKGIYQTWDANNNLTSKTDAEGRVSTYAYNATNQLISRTYASGTTEERTTSYEYVSADIDIVTKTISPSVYSGSANNKEVITGYDGELNATDVSITGFAPDGSAVSRTMYFEYDDVGKIIQIDGYRTDVDDFTTFSYYNCRTGLECGQLQSVSNALGHTTTYDSYDASGRLLQSTAQNGIVTTNTYHQRGWLLSQTQEAPNGEQRVTSFSYHNAGLLTQAVLADGTTLNYEYDESYALRAVSDNLGNRVEYTYDAKGNRSTIKMLDADTTLVRDIQVAYDIRNFVESINTAGSVTQMVNDAVGNLTTQTDPNQNPTTDHHYDGLYRLTSTIDALTNTTGYEYNVADQLIKVTAPNGAVTEYVYDDLGNLLSETSPDRGLTSYTHDEAGNVLSMTDARGITSNYSYDALNRLTNVNYPTTSENITYLYDTAGASSASDSNACHQTSEAFAVGRLCQITDESGQSNYQYDVWGNVQKHTKQELGHTFITQYQYDNANRVMQMTYPSGRVVDYQRDVIGRLIGTTTTDTEGTQTPLITNRNYRADGLWTEQVYGSGLTQSKSYDQQGRLTDHQVSNTGNTDEYSRQYEYDANGNITREHSFDSLYDTDYQYDALDRLTEELDSIKTLTRGFDYDANGNRLEESEDNNGTTQITPLTYTNQSNRIETINGQTLSIDPSGRTLQDSEGRSFAYNDAGRIRSISMNGQIVGEYFYNSKQLRTRKITKDEEGNELITVFHYDLAGNVIAESKLDESVGTTLVNLAENKTSEQISTGWGGVASRANDGNTDGVFNNGSVSHTLGENQPWWQVDLGSVSSINEVIVHNRSDCCVSRLRDMHVLVSDESFGSRTLDELLADDTIDRVFRPSYPLGPFSALFDNVEGRYVRIQLQGGAYLNLAEVQVMAHEVIVSYSEKTVNEYIYADGERVSSVTLEKKLVPINNSGSQLTNLAENKASEQISTGFGGVSSRANDGNTNGIFNNGSVSHTLGENQPWWQVDLGSVSSIDEIIVHNRSDCCVSRLRDMHVLVSDEPFGSRTLDELLADDTIDRVFRPSYPLGPFSALFDNVEGRYVRIQLQGGAYLNLAEVQVMGQELYTETMVENSIQFYVNDHLNTPQQLINQDNEVTWETEYEAFGEANIKTQQVTNNHRFPGQYYDHETGLHYNWNRYYDAGLGRYLTSDLIGLRGGLNTFGYVLGNPLKYIDPYGLDTIILSVDVRLPSFPGSGSMEGTDGAKPRGASIGIAISYPGAYGGEFDTGFTLTGAAGGSFGGGTGKITVSGTYAEGGLRDQSGRGIEVGFNDGVGGVTVGLDENNRPTSATVSVGPGIEISFDGTVTKVASLRDKFDSFFDHLGGLGKDPCFD